MEAVVLRFGNKNRRKVGGLGWQTLPCSRSKAGSG